MRQIATVLRARDNKMTGQWSIQIEHATDRTARVLFVPQGVTVGATFAVRQPRFRPLSIPESGEVRVCGDQVIVHIRPDGRPPHKGNLTIRWAGGGQARSWQPGDRDHENLGGPFLALDDLHRAWIPNGVRPHDPMVGFDHHVWDTSALTWALQLSAKEITGEFLETDDRTAELERLLAGKPPNSFPTWPERALKAREIVRHNPPGFFSASGLTLFRDDTPPWDPQAVWLKPQPDPQPYVLYVIYHDCNWKAAAGELVRLLGPIPKIPPFLLGIWYSNYSKLGVADFRDIVAEFGRYELPLDTISVDTHWHQRHWYGYDWNEELFPSPAGFGRWLREQELHATFNVHPLYVPADDSRADLFIETARHSGRVLGEEGSWHPYQAGCLEVDAHDQRQMAAYFAVLHRHVEQGGCSFWWIDGAEKQPDGRDVTSWLNHVYRAHLARIKGQTPIVLSRAGGLGSHRDAILFSGDACSQWEVLAFEVEMVARAAGTLMAYISHDIGGFYHDLRDRSENKPPDELYIRWVQFGCLSPIMRLHSFDGIREPWRFGPRVLSIVRRFFKLRMRLLPTLTALVDEAHETGVPPCRPTWFEFGEEDARRCTGQYMLGDSLLVAPVVRQDSVAAYWLPPGAWHDAFSTRQERGPRWIEEKVPLHVMPLWLRQGMTLEVGTPAARSHLVLAGPRRPVKGGGWANG